jgi:EAL domain-containing protein (putative c-di-GMP-specific phosphodiesterase class I)
MEALLRWHHEDFGQVSPVTFIPIAEENGLIVPLGRWVLLSACRAATTWQGGCVVCVNVSIHQLLAGDLLQDIERALQHSGLAANRLEIEITESMFAQDMVYICSVLESVRALGVSIAIDDFGTGYSSLAYLRRLPVDTIKIDRSFITEIDDDARKLLFSIVTMGRGLGFKIVAEGVETIQQEDLLLALGVDYLQGYLLSMPIPLAAAQTWLRTCPSRYKD